MAITVEVWSSLTAPEVEAQVLGVQIPTGVATDPRFELLRWVDPWGDTVFNPAQCQQLSIELKLLSPRPGSPLAAVHGLAAAVVAEPHTYLVFLGD